MIYKTLFSEIIMQIDELQECGLKYPVSLSYYVTESEADGSYGIYSGNVYGMEIVKQDLLPDNNQLECKLIANYSNSREETSSFIDMLARNRVTPSELPYVIDDFLGIK